jgi:WD40 repeat protein
MFGSVHAKRSVFLLSFALLVTAGTATGLWAMLSVRPRCVLPGSERFEPIQFSPDGQTLLAVVDENEKSGSQPSDWVTGLWDLATSQRRTGFTMKLGRNGISFAPDGRLAVLQPHGVIQLHDLHTGKDETHFVADIDEFSQMGWLCPEGANLTAALFSPDRRTLAVLDQNGEPRLYNLATRRLLPSFENFSGFSRSSRFSADGKLFAAVSESEHEITAQAWNVDTGQEQCTWRIQEMGQHGNFMLAPDLQCVIVEVHEEFRGTCPIQEQAITLWNLATGNVTVLIHNGTLLPSWVENAKYAPDGKTLAFTVRKNSEPDEVLLLLQRFLPIQVVSISTYEVVLWDVLTSRPRAVLPGCFTGVFSPDGQMFASASPDGGPIHIWDDRPRKPAGMILALSAAAGCLIGMVGWWRRRA